MIRRVPVVAAAAAVLLGVLAGCAAPAGQPSQLSTSAGSGSASTLAAERAKARLAPCPTGPAGPSSAGPSSAGRPGADTLPDLVLPCLSGGPDVRLTALTGTPMVLTGWASWCQPCQRELPYFQQLADATAGRLRVLGVDSAEPSMDDPLTFAAASGLHFASLYDQAGRLRVACGIAGLPFTLLVRADGTVATVQVGPIESAALVAAVQRYLGVRPDG